MKCIMWTCRIHKVNINTPIHITKKWSGPTTWHDGGTWRERRYTSHSLNLGTRREWVVSFMSWPCFTTRERIPVTYYTGGWLDPREGLDAQARKKISASVGNQTLVIQSAVKTLYWLSYPLTLKYKLIGGGNLSLPGKWCLRIFKSTRVKD
jgi:hypothetical protein